MICSENQLTGFYMIFFSLVNSYFSIAFIYYCYYCYYCCKFTLTNWKRYENIKKDISKDTRYFFKENMVFDENVAKHQATK